MKIERFKGELLVALIITSTTSLAIPLLSTGTVHAALTSHAPIYINGNAGFTKPDPVNGGGSGIAGDPYIIENYSISAKSAVGITIQNTTAYFIVRNCLVENGGGSYEGIYLYNVVNGKIENNTCDNSHEGIELESSTYDIVSNNSGSNNIDCGIQLWAATYDNITGNTFENSYVVADYGGYGIAVENGSQHNIVSTNSFSYNSCGILLYRTSSKILVSYNTVTYNTCNHTSYGIELDYAYSNLISNNTCENDDYGINLYYDNYDNLTNNVCGYDNYGIYLSHSPYNILTNSTCNNNSVYGIALYNSSNNNNCINGTTDNIRIGSGCNYNIFDLFWTTNSNSGTGNTLIKPPNVPINLAPTSAQSSTTVTISAFDKDNYSSSISGITVYFYDNSADNLINSEAISNSGDTASVTWSGLGTATYTFFAQAMDNYGGLSHNSNTCSFSDKAHTVNQPPTTPTTLTLPSSVKVGQVLTATASGSTDNDNDSITYYYRFYNQTVGVERQAYSTTNTYTIQGVDNHDNIRVFAEAYDGENYSSSIENSIIVTNTPPVMTSNVVTPSSPLDNDNLVCTPTAMDNDGDTITYSYQWYENGVLMSGQTNSTLSSSTIINNNYKCLVTPNDGYENGTTTYSNEVTIIGLSVKPNFPTTLLPYVRQTTTNVSISCVDTENNGDQITVYFYDNSNKAEIGDNTISSGGTAIVVWSGLTRGNTYVFFAIGEDNNGNWSDNSATQSFLVNTQPVMTSNIVTPSFPYKSDTLTDTPSSTDAELDNVSYFYQWYENSVLMSGRTSSALSASYTSVSSKYKCQVTPNDGYENGTATYSNEVTVLLPPMYSSHTPISITSNSQFDNSHGVNGGGSGTSGNPYIIENWVISASSANGIKIQNTTTYFIVRNCLIENGGSTYSGIYFYNVINGTIYNNICGGNRNGIEADHSSYDNLTNNTCKNSTNYGIELYYDNNFKLTNDNCSNNVYGIDLSHSPHNTLTNNTCNNNTTYGIALYNSSTNNNCINGVCSGNTKYDVRNSSCNYNVFDFFWSTSSSSGTGVVLIKPPNTPSSLSPTSTQTSSSVTISAYDNDKYSSSISGITVYFYDNSSNSLIDSNAIAKTGGTASVTWNGLGTATYTFFAQAMDNYGGLSYNSNTCSFSDNVTSSN